MSTRRALFFSFLDRYSGLTLAIASSMVIARLLTPAELGIFSVTMVLIGFVAALRDLGAGQYLVQAKELDAEKVGAVWTVLLGMGGLMALLVAALAHPVALFYEHAEITSIMFVIAANFVINPFGSITYAWLMREMRFEALAMMRFGSGLAGAVVSIYLAWAGHGPISLAWGNFAATCVNALLALHFRPATFSWWPRFTGVRQVLSFGSRISGTSLVANIGGGAPEMFLGKLQGMAAAGLYSRSNGLAAMFQRLLLDATQSVATPLFARTARAGSDVAAPFLRSVSYVTALGWSFFIGLALLSLPLTRLLYGGQWDDSAELTRLLALGLACSLPAAMCPQVLMGVGRPGRLLNTMVKVVLVQVLCVGVGASFGLLATGAAYVVSQLFSVWAWLRAAHSEVPFDWAALRTELLRSMGLAAFVALAPTTVVLVFGLRTDAIAAPLALAALGGAALFVVGARLLKHPINGEITAIVARTSASLRGL